MSAIDVTEVEAFVAVARELHFGRAAERLGTRQSSVSRKVRRLEDRLGVPLFERSTRSVRLTGPGAALLQPAASLLESVRRLDAQVRLAAEGGGEYFSVGFVSSA